METLSLLSFLSWKVERAVIRNAALTLDELFKWPRRWSALASTGQFDHAPAHNLDCSVPCQTTLWCEGVCPAPCTNLHVGHRGWPQMTCRMGLSGIHPQWSQPLESIRVFILASAIIMRFIHIMSVIGVSYLTGTKIALIWLLRATDVIGSGDVISWVYPSFLYV